MNEIIGKTQLLHTSHLPQKSTVNKINLFDEAKIENDSKKLFSDLGTELARIPLLKLQLKPK